MKHVPIPILIAGLLALAGCAHNVEYAGHSAPPASQTRESQSAATPATALAALKAGNARFVSGQSLHRDFLAQVKQTSTGQFPFASIVSCMDSRTSSELVFDQGLGDIFNVRVAGNIVNSDILGSLEYGSKVAGSKLIAVVGHTKCGAVGGACDNVKLGNLTGLVQQIRPAVEQTPPANGEHTSGHDYTYVNRVAETNVRLTLQAIRERSPVLRELIDSGKVGLVGGIYDVTTGTVHFLD
ncbi:MAG TPA: carbonic anhydrase family protein [Candidatus Limnocylindria bacterium]|jgi:carbonic anhydrase|nr:carbonic anhydrase family protein [Candidatus Limnocylindria bacterium]